MTRPTLHDRAAKAKWPVDPRYPYRHHGPPVHGSKMADYLISEFSLREDHPELFEDYD